MTNIAFRIWIRASLAMTVSILSVPLLAQSNKGYFDLGRSAYSNYPIQAPLNRRPVPVPELFVGPRLVPNGSRVSTSSADDRENSGAAPFFITLAHFPEVHHANGSLPFYAHVRVSSSVRPESDAERPMSSSRRLTTDFDSLIQKEANCSGKDSGQCFVGPTFSIEPDTNRWHTVDGKFVLLSALTIIASLADIETTAHAIETNPSAKAANPLFGTRPSRPRLYGTSIPIDFALIALSYHLKRIAPRRETWKNDLKLSSVLELFAAFHNVWSIRK